MEGAGMFHRLPQAAQKLRAREPLLCQTEKCAVGPSLRPPCVSACLGLPLPSAEPVREPLRAPWLGIMSEEIHGLWNQTNQQSDSETSACNEAKH